VVRIISESEYNEFVDAVAKGEKFGAHEEVEADCIDNLRPFEGCMPIEEMVARGPETLRFGPFKPVGLTDPRTGKRPYAVAQLRQDNKEATLWSMVGMQTRLKHAEQLRIFRMLPGLHQAEFVRLGSVHRNTFINSPLCMHPTMEFRTQAGLFFAGQMTGVEGYVESTAAGLVAGINAARLVSGQEALAFPKDTAIGSLLTYISDPNRTEFQPMNISFGLMPSYFENPGRRISKDERRQQTSERALQSLGKFLDLLGLKSATPGADISLQAV
jgi:methylenetetrahydrofolate--tRNA-(uracil-5-)-methyltransferase